MIRTPTNRGHNGRNVIKVVVLIIGHVLDSGFHVKESKRMTSLITYVISQRINNVQVECKGFVPTKPTCWPNSNQHCMMQYVGLVGTPCWMMLT